MMYAKENQSAGEIFYTVFIPWKKVNVKYRCGGFKLILMHDKVKWQENSANYRLFFFF